MPSTDKTGEQAADEVNAAMLARYESYLRANLPTRHTQNGQPKDRQGAIVGRFRKSLACFSLISICSSVNGPKPTMGGVFSNGRSSPESTN